MQMLSSSTQGVGTSAIVRHPEWMEQNPFNVINIPVRDLTAYRANELIAFARACQRIYKELDHPDLGNGINPTRLAEVNNAIGLLENSEPSQIANWAEQFRSQKLVEELLLEEEFDNEINRLESELDLLKISKSEIEKSFRYWIEESIEKLTTEVDESHIAPKADIRFEDLQYQPTLKSASVERFKSMDRNVLNHSTLAEEIILGGAANPLETIPIPENLLELILKHKDIISIKDSFAKLRRPIFKLFHTDASSYDTTQEFIRLSKSFKVLEDLSNDGLQIVIQSYLRQQQKLKLQKIASRIKVLDGIQASVESAANDLTKVVKLYDSVKSNLATISQPDFFRASSTNYLSLMFLVGKVFPVNLNRDVASDRKPQTNKEDISLYTVDKHGVLYKAEQPVKAILIDHREMDDQQKNFLTTAASEAKFVPCGFLAGSIARISNGSGRQAYIGSVGLSATQIARIEGLSDSILVHSSPDFQEERSVKPLIFVTTDKDCELLVLHPPYGLQYQPNFDPIYSYHLARNAAISIIDRECVLQSARKYSDHGCTVMQYGEKVVVEYQSKGQTLTWHLDEPHRDDLADDNIVLLKKVLDSLQPIPVLQAITKMCDELLKEKFELKSADGVVTLKRGSTKEKNILQSKGYADTDHLLDPAESLEVTIAQQGGNFRIELLGEQRAYSADGTGKINHSTCMKIFRIVRKHFNLQNTSN